MEKQEVKKVVREGYACVVRAGNPRCMPVDSCCAPSNSCCGSTSVATNISKAIGYTDEDMQAVPEGANLGLGCGNPIALASLREGDVVIDLGSGAGFDCFLVANKVGKSGRVIGVDMTPEMVEKARENVLKSNYQNVEFRLGEIENLPVADNSADVIISNCVINLSPDKERVLQEAFRVLKPGGRLTVSDIVLLQELPETIKNSVAAYIGCVSGAIKKETYVQTVQDAGFKDVQIMDETYLPIDCIADDPTVRTIINDPNIPQGELRKISNSIRSIKVQAIKPSK